MTIALLLSSAACGNHTSALAGCLVVCLHGRHQSTIPRGGDGGGAATTTTTSMPASSQKDGVASTHPPPPAPANVAIVIAGGGRIVGSIGNGG